MINHHDELLEGASAGALATGEARVSIESTSSPMELIPATAWPRELRALTGQEPPAYGRLYRMMLDDRLGIEVVRVGSRLFAHKADIPAMAIRLGMTPRLPALADTAA